MADTYIASELNHHWGWCRFCGHRKGMLVVHHEAYGRIQSEYPTRYADGRLGWDWPERIPDRWRELAGTAAALSAYTA